MGTFNASLKTLGDRSGLPATVSLEDDVLSITAGEQEIGSWSLEDITLEPTASGYRMGAEGEQIIIEMPDKEAFAEELSRRLDKKRHRFLRKEKSPAEMAKSAKTAAAPEPPHTPPSYQVAATPAVTEVSREPVIAKPAGSPPAQTLPAEAKASTEEQRQAVMDRIDGALVSAEKRWGSLMPTWFFTRLMVFVVVGALVLMLIFPAAVSTFLLAAGMLLVIIGAIVYTDGMLASKWLPGRMTPTHVLMFGVAILMFGVLLGVIARS